MLGRTHLGTGILTSLLLCNGEAIPFCMVCLGSVLPDIDQGSSMIGKNVPLIPKLLKHRGLTHSLLFCLCCYFLTVWLCVGVAIHILFDMMTRNGVSLFYPHKGKIRLPLAKYVVTNGKFERIVFYAVYLCIVALLCKQYGI